LFPQKQDKLSIRTTLDVASARQKVRAWCAELGFTIVDQTKLVTAASELARNTLVYGGGGEMIMESFLENGRNALRLTFEDQGPGIPDVELALKDGYSTGGGLGMGLSGAKRLVNEFQIETAVGKGTRVRVTKWH
jgi:serine/threonine-protein kinase RsbT